MKKDTRLFIGSEEVELTQGFDILYNYAIDDVSAPTAVKNGFSKTLTVMGTPSNDKVFGHYWNVERRVGNAGQNAGVDFNASKKAPFQIFINDEVYESGYAKLDKVNVLDGEISYDISLYGDIGNYFLNLSVNDNTGEKLKLSDMDYWEGGSDEFDFTVTASTVKLAWDKLQEGEEGKWSHINFMPAYNGYPADFDADKVIINLSGTSLQQQDASGLFRPRDGMVIADLPSEMTEWEMRDLRSYLQRPVFRMKSIIQACCDPDQNGGYEVDLDPDFFSSGNPYYEKTWITLPLLQNLEYSNEEQILVGSTLVGMTTTGDTASTMYQDLKFSMGSYSNSIPSSILVGTKVFVNNIFNNWNSEVQPELGGLADVRTPSTSFMWFWNKKGDSYHSGWNCLGSLFVQMIALNGESVVGASQAYNLTTPIRHNGKLYFGHNGHYSKENQFVPYLNKSIQDVLGDFQTDGFHREGSNEPNTLYFHIDNLNSPVTQLKIVYWWGATDNKIKHFKRNYLFGQTEDSSWIDIGGPEPSYYGPAAFGLTVSVVNSNFSAVVGESMGRSGTKVTKAMLLNTEASPCDYLLSYCKMFGLYFRKDVNTNKIQILTRKSYYQRDNIVNLGTYIDRSKDIKITPVAFSSKWYEFGQEMDETEWYKKYLEAKGVQYGVRILNTGYEFNTEKKKLFEDNVLKSGIEGLERSKWFTAYNNDNALRPWMGNGMHYDLYLGPSSFTVNTPIIDSTAVGINEGEGMKYYDVFPKLQFHNKDNEPTDGNNVLVFFSGFKNVTTGRTNPLSYYLTDDNMYQTLFNDSTPCWLFTTSEYAGENKIATKVNDLPVFERYYTNASSGKVNKSLDFGTSQELYVPDYSLTEDACIYYNFWQRYMEDMCDPDTKMLDCYVRVDGKINDEWLRRFYYFDNTIWRLNKITDWNVGSYDTTKMEFVQVQDVSNYTSLTQDDSAWIGMIASSYRIPKNGGQVTLYITTEGNLSWRIVHTDDVVLSKSSGTGDDVINATFPANNSDKLKYWYFTADAGVATARLTIVQGYAGEVDFRIVPEDILVPASGGQVTVDFVWTNQGNDYIASASTNESLAEGLLHGFSADITTYASQNKAVLTFPANTGATALHNYCLFEDMYEGIGRAMGIDQLPTGYTFNPAGESKAMQIVYSPNATFENLPTWVYINENEDKYVINAKRNLYDESNDDTTIMVNIHGVKAPLRLVQGSGTGMPTEGVTPDNLHFNATGGTQFFSLTMNNGWSASTSPSNFCTVTPMNGDGSTVISVSMSANTGTNTKSGTITLVNTTTGNRCYVYVTQAGSDVAKSLTVSPSTTSVAASGGSVSYSLFYQNRGTDGISIGHPAAVSASSVAWQGESGTTTVIVPANYSPSAKTYTITFSNSLLSESVTITQPQSSPMVIPSDMYITLPATGLMDNNYLDFISTVSWYASSDDSWISFSPTGDTYGNKRMYVSAEANDGNQRNGTIYIKDSGTGDTLATVHVTQLSKYDTLSVFPSVITFGETGGTATFTITTNTNWTIS
jgi:hypothetical protein